MTIDAMPGSGQAFDRPLGTHRGSSTLVHGLPLAGPSGTQYASFRPRGLPWPPIAPDPLPNLMTR